jgi:ubiquinone/menaquinone biosynthesis C-methylase UbiE
MATDIQQVIGNVKKQYKMDNRVVITAGAGGGQFVDYYETAAHIYGIEKEETAMAMLKNKIEEKGLEGKYECIQSDYFDIEIKGDVVVFEFSLHEMNDIKKAMEKGKKIAQEILIIDHSWKSEWITYVDEVEKVERVKEYIDRNKPKKIEHFSGIQKFKDYNELKEKVKIQGKKALDSIEKFMGQKNIKIEFGYMVVQY